MPRVYCWSDGHLYIACMLDGVRAGQTKVGFTTQTPEARIRQIASRARATRVDVIFVTASTQRQEREFHERYGAQSVMRGRRRGGEYEWYDFTEAQLDTWRSRPSLLRGVMTMPGRMTRAVGLVDARCAFTLIQC